MSPHHPLRAIGPLAVLVFAVACGGGGPATPDATATSAAPLVADEALSSDVTLYPDRLVVPARGHEDLLAWPAGRLVVGRRAHGHNGFLRRALSVERDGETIVVRTGRPSLTEAIASGELRASGGVGDQVLGAPTLTRDDVGAGAGGAIDLAGAVVLAQKELLGADGSIGSSGVHVTLDARVREGHVSFRPTFDTHVVIDWGQLRQFDMMAKGDLDAKLVVDVDVHADGELTASLAKELKPAHTTQKLVSFPRVYLPPQMIGLVPVYEAIDVSVSLGCDFTFGAEAHVTAGVEVQGHAEAGGKLVDGVWRPTGAAPSFSLTPTLAASVGGALSVTCSLEPEAALLFYDMAGPTLSIGPYVEADVTRDARGASWAVYPGVRAEIGGDFQIFGRDIASASFTIFDAKSATPLVGSGPSAP